MKLYSLPHSPYATRVRIQVRERGLPVEILPPPVPLRTDAFLERFPLGKVPVLELANGTTIAESWAIMEYLEETHPDSDRALLPADPLARARVRELSRYADLHLAVEALFPLFRAVMAGADADTDEIRQGLRAQLAKGERLLQQAAKADGLDLGDIALAPTLWYLEALAPRTGLERPLDEYPALASWWERVRSHPSVTEVLGEMAEAFRAIADSTTSKA